MSGTVRDIMSSGCECIGEGASVQDAARKLAELNVGALPICGDDDRLKGMVTDRDIVIKVVAQGKDPATTTAGELGQGKPVTIGPDDSVDAAVKTMAQHQIRRLPVIEDHQLVGIVSQADVARNTGDQQTGELVQAISTA